MRIAKKTFKRTIAISFCILLLLYITDKFGAAVVRGSVKPLYLTLGFSILIIIPYIVRRLGVLPLVCGLVFIYWLPLRARMSIISPALAEAYPFEVGIWILFVGILIRETKSQSTQWHHLLNEFPFLPFSVFIGSALIVYIATGVSSLAFVRIRMLCFIPAIWLFVVLYVIKTPKQAEFILWLFLISSVLLGIVYLYAPQFADPIQSTEYVRAAISNANFGRLTKVIKLPLFGILYMSAETNSIYFGFVGIQAFNLWLNHLSFWKRTAAGVIFCLCTYVIAQGQGRTAIISLVFSICIVTALTWKVRQGFIKNSLLKIMIAIPAFVVSIWYVAITSEILSYRQRITNLVADPLYSLESRMWRWTTSLPLLCDNPFGTGFYGVPTYLDRFGSTWFPHNLYLSLGLSTGIIGLIGFCWVLIFGIKVFLCGLRSGNYIHQLLSIGAIGSISLLLVAGIGSCIFWEARELLVFWIPIGIAMAVNIQNENDAGLKKSGGTKTPWKISETQ
jgi:hypothetical protein